MGFFQWLFGGSPQVSGQHRIWLSAEAKRNGLERAASQFIEHNPGGSVLFIVHFDETLSALPKLDQPNVAATLARDLDSACQNLSEAEALLALVAERHFLTRWDQDVENTLGNQTIASDYELQYHLALDDPLLAGFADNVRSILESLGMSDDEPIESEMVARRITAIQRKHAKHTAPHASAKAQSPQAWLEKNGSLH